MNPESRVRRGDNTLKYLWFYGRQSSSSPKLVEEGRGTETTTKMTKEAKSTRERGESIE